MSIFLLATLLATTANGCAGCSSAPSTQALDGCQVVDESSGTFVLTCPGTILAATEGDKDRADAFVEGVEGSVTDFAKGPVTRQATQLVVDGEPRALRKMTANGRLVLLLVDARGPKVRAISCTGGLTEEASCQRLFTTVWPWEFALGPPGFIPRKIERLIAGRQFSVPAGCTITTAPGYGSMSCSDLSVMTWRSMAPGTNVSADGAPDDSTGEIAEPCVVEGVPTKCRIVGYTASGVVRAKVLVRGTNLAVACQSARTGSGVPRACANFISFGNGVDWPR